MALREQPYLPLYVQDFMTDEKLNECSAKSTGVYIRLMCLMHKSETYGKILLKQKYRQSENQISNFALQFAFQLSKQMPFEVETIRESLEELIDNGVLSVDGYWLYQKRMVRDSELSKKRSAAGSKGGRPSKSNKDLLNQNQKQNESKTKANSESEIEIENENERKRDSAEREKEPFGFDSFWSAYPRKVGKGNARKSWLKIDPDQELLTKILSAVERDKKTDQWQREGGQFIPHPATWLNQERWEDEPDTVPPTDEPPEPFHIPNNLPEGKTWADVYGDHPAEIGPDTSWEDLVE